MITVGITELHGIAREVMASPPIGVNYVKTQSTPSISDFFIRSPAKGVMRHFKGDNCDILEAPLFPILTNKPWIYTPARFSGATSFNFLGAPIPRGLRVQIVKQMFLRENFVKLLFKSHAGANTLQNYAHITDERILEKVDIVYPCMRRVDDSHIKQNTNRTNFMFSGDFFRKGGASVVDAFEQLAKDHDNVYLRICAPPEMRFKDTKVIEHYRVKISEHDRITFGAVDRATMLDSVLPNTDVFVSPTFQEAFGFAILEASAYGIPVISTNHFAIPEIIEHDVSGLLIDTDQFDFISKGSYDTMSKIPESFQNYLTNAVYNHMECLHTNKSLRNKLGFNALRIARSKFSIEERNRKMVPIYEQAIDINRCSIYADT